MAPRRIRIPARSNLRFNNLAGNIWIKLNLVAQLIHSTGPFDGDAHSGVFLNFGYGDNGIKTPDS